MDTELYRELHDALGDEKTLDKVLLRELAADELGNALAEAPEWSILSQFDSDTPATELIDPE